MSGPFCHIQMYKLYELYDQFVRANRICPVNSHFPTIRSKIKVWKRWIRNNEINSADFQWALQGPICIWPDQIHQKSVKYRNEHTRKILTNVTKNFLHMISKCNNFSYKCNKCNKCNIDVGDRCWRLFLSYNQVGDRIKILVTSFGCWCPALMLRYRGCWWPILPTS